MSDTVVSGPVIAGILIDRDRPAGSGHCGTENCQHSNHKYKSRRVKYAKLPKS
jgi:hypothetical protein